VEKPPKLGPPPAYEPKRRATLEEFGEANDETRDLAADAHHHAGREGGQASRVKAIETLGHDRHVISMYRPRSRCLPSNMQHGLMVGGRLKRIADRDCRPLPPPAPPHAEMAHHLSSSVKNLITAHHEAPIQEDTIAEEGAGTEA
jgi:hypothetical protein